MVEVCTGANWWWLNHRKKKCFFLLLWDSPHTEGSIPQIKLGQNSFPLLLSFRPQLQLFLFLPSFVFVNRFYIFQSSIEAAVSKPEPAGSGLSFYRYSRFDSKVQSMCSAHSHNDMTLVGTRMAFVCLVLLRLTPNKMKGSGDEMCWLKVMQLTFLETRVIDCTPYSVTAHVMQFQTAVRYRAILIGSCRHWTP